MTIELTEQLRQILNEAAVPPPTLTDPETDTEYVLVRADDYARLRSLADGMTKRAGWDEPELDDYERYRKA